MKNADRTKKLAQIYKKADSLDEDIPIQLMQKLTLYGQALEIIGGLHAESVKAWKLAEAKRREVIASSIIYGAEIEGEPVTIKTAKDREAAAEVIGATARREEALAEAEAQRWKNAYQSTLEMINILKKKYDHLKEVAKGGI